MFLSALASCTSNDAEPVDLALISATSFPFEIVEVSSVPAPCGGDGEAFFYDMVDVLSDSRHSAHHDVNVLDMVDSEFESWSVVEKGGCLPVACGAEACGDNGVVSPDFFFKLVGRSAEQACLFEGMERVKCWPVSDYEAALARRVAGAFTPAPSVVDEGSGGEEDGTDE